MTETPMGVKMIIVCILNNSQPVLRPLAMGDAGYEDVPPWIDPNAGPSG